MNEYFGIAVILIIIAVAVVLDKYYGLEKVMIGFLQIVAVIALFVCVPATFSNYMENNFQATIIFTLWGMTALYFLMETVERK